VAWWFARSATPESAPKLVVENPRQTAGQATVAPRVAEPQRKAEEAKNIGNASKDQPWENSLGMKFVPVPGTNVLVSIWDTRVQDYQAFVNATGRSWERPSFEQGPTHPAVDVSWDDAKAFCAWLTKRERKDGKIGPAQEYRLPTDEEWSAAVGLPQESGTTPHEKGGTIEKVYPWGEQWPPPKGAGDYASSLNVDSYEYTSPVGSFSANKYGLYDMGGNVLQWCEDRYDAKEAARVLRGASWYNDRPDYLLSSYRYDRTPSLRDDSYGFRVVVTGLASAR
jgi:formylglycine-generating enzyme required for sulfatase activity